MQDIAYRQGDFDGLCGLYAILNAVNVLSPQRPDDLELLFDRLIGYLVRNRYHRVISRGMGPGHLWLLANEAKRLVKRRFHQNVWLEWTSASSVVDAWELLRDVVARDSVAIVGLSEPFDHWTLVTDINRRYARFCDSGPISGVRRSDLLGRRSRRFKLDITRILVLSA